MHTVEFLERALAVATQCGYRIRHEWLAGGGGSCEIGGQQWIFVDLAQNPTEQFGAVLDALRADPQLGIADLTPPQLADWLTSVPLRKSA